MNAADLKRYGFKPVARVQIAERVFEIDNKDPDAVKLTECIYAFVAGGKVVRVGSSKAPLGTRLKDYERDITNALNGRKSPAPAEEARKWRKALPSGSSGTVYARRGTIVTTPLGKFPVYMDEESRLIGMLFNEHPHDHVINRYKHR